METINPYWDIVQTIPSNPIDMEYGNAWSPNWIRHGVSRDELCRTYSWAIPSPFALSFVAKWVKLPVVEMGAGTGYWAWQLSQMGIDIIAYDQAPPDKTGTNHWHSPRNGSHGDLTGETRPTYFPVQEGTPESLKAHSERVLFLCWPPYDDTMAFECLENYQGNRLVYIGEGSGGCTADDAFHERLDREWEEVANHRPIQWFGIHDYITVYLRKSDT